MHDPTKSLNMDIFVFFQHLLVLPIPLKNSLFAFQSSLLRVHAMIMPIHTWTLHPHAADSTICWVYSILLKWFRCQVFFSWMWIWWVGKSFCWCRHTCPAFCFAVVDRLFVVQRSFFFYFEISSDRQRKSVTDAINDTLHGSRLWRPCFASSRKRSASSRLPGRQGER